MMENDEVMTHRHSRRSTESYMLLFVCLILLMIVDLRQCMLLIVDASASSFFPQHDAPIARSSSSSSGAYHSSKDLPRAHLPVYPTDDGNVLGTLSHKPLSFFQEIRNHIDSLDDEERCRNYGFGYNHHHKIKRNVYFGALIASEPWELLEIVGTESYGMYKGIVLVESNRTQNFSPRNLTRLQHVSTIAQLFGMDDDQNIQIRQHVNENSKLQGLPREHDQRGEILKGWKSLGMNKEDIGLLSDSDEVLSRDFLRAIQVCDIPRLDYHRHHCQPNRMGVRAAAQVYEGSPECIVDGRHWFHPSVFNGHCIEEIGDEREHPKAPVRDVDSQRGEGWSVLDWNESNSIHPLVSSTDIRMMGAAGNRTFLKHDRHGALANHSAYHFHNFFSSAKAIRFKYKTYGHANKEADVMRLDDLQGDLALMARCARGQNESTSGDENDFKWNRIEGGFTALEPFRPIYFEDDDYRKRRHDLIRDVVLEEDRNYARSRQARLEN